MDHLRIGDILMQRGILKYEQVLAALEQQTKTGEPFGVICERLFDVSPDTIEDVWASQYVSITRKIDPRCEAIDPAALQLVSRRQAWQFRVLPVRWDGRELMIATAPQHVRRALRFATRFLGVPVYLVVADSQALGEAMCRHYPFAGMTPASIDAEFPDEIRLARRNAAA